MIGAELGGHVGFGWRYRADLIGFAGVCSCIWALGADGVVDAVMWRILPDRYGYGYCCG